MTLRDTKKDINGILASKWVKVPLETGDQLWFVYYIVYVRCSGQSSMSTAVAICHMWRKLFSLHIFSVPSFSQIGHDVPEGGG